MRPTIPLLLTLAAVLNFGICAPGATIDVDTILGPNNPVRNAVVVAGASPPTRVTLIEGASVGSATLAMDVFDSSVIEVLGGSISSSGVGVRLNNDARMYVRGGVLNTSFAGVEGRGRSFAAFDGGVLVGGFATYESSRAVVRTNIRNSGHLFDNSRVAVTEGHLNNAHVNDNSIFDIRGGITAQVFVQDEGQALIRGGWMGRVELYGQATTTLRGGRVNAFRVFDEGLVHIYGYGLQFQTEDSDHIIAGTLADGSWIRTDYNFEAQDQIILHEVPEPATWGILAVGLVAVQLYAHRRRPHSP